VVQVEVPWSNPRSRFTLLFERFAIEVIRQCATVTGARRLLRISWDECFGLMQRAVARGQARKKREVIPLFSVDEKAIARRHRYVTLVCDYACSTVEHIVEGRKEEGLAAYWRGLTPEQLAGIEAVSMDMWEPFVQATLKGVPDARKKRRCPEVCGKAGVAPADTDRIPVRRLVASATPPRWPCPSIRRSSAA
jgi:transposase